MGTWLKMPWPCKTCTFVNQQDQFLACEMCGTQRQSAEAIGGMKISSGGATLLKSKELDAPANASPTSQHASTGLPAPQSFKQSGARIDAAAAELPSVHHASVALSATSASPLRLKQSTSDPDHAQFDAAAKALPSQPTRKGWDCLRAPTAQDMRMARHRLPPEPMQHMVVLDFEWTCDDKKHVSSHYVL